MVSIGSLWLAILLSSVFVFLVSSVLHMLLPIHKSDYSRLDREGDVLDALRSFNLKPGDYMFPSCASMKEMGSKEFLERLQRGPVGMLTVRPNAGHGMGKALMQWFLFCVLVGVFVAYIAGLGTPAGAGFSKVFRVTSAVAVLGYAFWCVHTSIWKAVAWSTTVKFIIDGVIYGLVTGATFAWLWPTA